MAGSKSTYLENKVLNHVLGADTYTPPATVYVALSSAVYDEAATGAAFNEITGNGAARVAVTNNATNWPDSGTGSVKTNGVAITFPAATASWPTARSFYLLDGSNNLLYGGDLATPRTLLAGDTASFAPGALSIQED